MRILILRRPPREDPNRYVNDDRNRQNRSSNRISDRILRVAAELFDALFRPLLFDFTALTNGLIRRQWIASVDLLIRAAAEKAVGGVEAAQAVRFFPAFCVIGSEKGEKGK